MRRKLDVKGRVARPTVCADRIQQVLRVLRNEGVEKLERFIDLAIGAAGNWPPAPKRALAQFTSIVMQGVAKQARDGATRDELQAAAALAV